MQSRSKHKKQIYQNSRKVCNYKFLVSGQDMCVIWSQDLKEAKEYAAQN